MDHVTIKATATNTMDAWSSIKERLKICRWEEKRLNVKIKVGQPVKIQQIKAMTLEKASPPRRVTLFFLFLFFGL